MHFSQVETRAAELRFAGFSLKSDERSLQYHASAVLLTPKELDLLIFLAHSTGRALGKEEIIARVWPNTPISDSALSQTVYRLRRTLARYNPGVEYISTIPGQGYQFVAPLDERRSFAASPAFANSAFRLYRTAMFKMNRRTKVALEESILLLERSLKINPEYVYAMTALSECYAFAGCMLYFDPRIAYPSAKEWAVRALKIDPLFGDAFSALSTVSLFGEQDRAAAANAARDALALAPFSTKARCAAALECLSRGDTGQALSHMGEAMQVDPLSSDVTALFGVALYFAQRFDEARTLFAESLLVDPRHTHALYYDARALCMLQSYAAASERLDQITSTDLLPHVAGLRGYVAARLGDTQTVQDVLRTLESAPVVSNLAIATVLLGAGRDDEATARIRSAASLNEPAVAFVASDPFYVLARAARC